MVLFGLLAAAVLLSLPASIPLPRLETKEQLRFASANLYFGNHEVEALTQRLLALNADVLLLLEWSGHNLDLGRMRQSGLRVVVNHARAGTHGILVVARVGLALTAQVHAAPVRGPCAMPYVSLRMRRDTQSYALLGIHVPPPISACVATTNATLRYFAQYIENGKLTAHLAPAQIADPVILMGDFNALPFAPSIRRFQMLGLIDSYGATNWRPGPTWSPVSWMPAIARIDYIFVSREILVRDARSITLPGSDHRLVVTDVALSNSLD